MRRILTTLVLASAPSSCGESHRDPPRRTEANELEDLRALGYVQWDENADAALSGVTLHDAARAAPGYNLHTNDVDEVLLLDLEGRRQHTWRLPGKSHCEYAELLDDGGLIAVSAEQSLTLLDWSSRVVWELDRPFHHDVHVLADGSFLAPCRERPRRFRGRHVAFDALVRISRDGRTLEEWSTFEHMDELKPHHSPSELDVRPTPGELEDPSTLYDYYHLNSVEVLPHTPLGEHDARFRAGNLLICLRNVDVIAIVDANDGSIAWAWGSGTLEHPHMPTMLANGHILIFDNGTFRGFSRVLELDPASGEIVWSYQGDPPASFFSEWRGSNQRLANGNTLVCESERGRAFEVTREGALVWEYWNPELKDGARKRIYRLLRFEPTRVEPLLERFGTR